MKKLIVPSNMALQWELFPGFGKKELVRTGIVCLAGSALLYAGVLIQLFNTLIAIGLFLVLLTISIQLFARTVFNTSMFDQISLGEINKGLQWQGCANVEAALSQLEIEGYIEKKRRFLRPEVCDKNEYILKIR